MQNLLIPFTKKKHMRNQMQSFQLPKTNEAAFFSSLKNNEREIHLNIQKPSFYTQDFGPEILGISEFVQHSKWAFPDSHGGHILFPTMSEIWVQYC